MTMVFKPNQSNFPNDSNELELRLSEIEKLINKLNANIDFCKAAFQLMEDCNLITAENIRFLYDAQACKKYDSNFWFIRNRREGVFRQVEDYNDVFSGNYRRFYSGYDMRIEFYGQTFLITNDWYKDFSKDRHSEQEKPSLCPNKRAFYKWLKKTAEQACQKHWMQNKPIISVKTSTQVQPVTTTTSEPPAKSSPLEVLIDKVEKLDKVNTSLCVLVVNLHKKIETLENKVDDLTSEVNELKRRYVPKSSPSSACSSRK